MGVPGRPADASEPAPASAGGAPSRFLRLWAPALLVLFAAAVAALAPLYEMDLAQHLATGEWIARHRAVPFVEPFAWTRAGRPYFAYSWLAELTFYLLLRAFGPLALHLLEAAIVAGAVAAALWAARQFRWLEETALAVAALHLVLLWGVASTLRPQQLLLVAVPLAWGIAARIRRDGPAPRRLAALAAVGALAANTHLFFPLTACPILYWLLSERPERRWLVAGAALVAGWLISPYALAWPRVFALNFGHNILLARPPSIREFVPGFEYWRHLWGVVAAVATLLAAPWLARVGNWSGRRRLVAGLFWAGGLVLFAYAGRLVFVWWGLALPLVGGAADVAFQRWARVLARPACRDLMLGGAAVVLVACAPTPRPDMWRFEGDTVHRMLPRAAEDPALWLPSWLLCHTRPGAHGRILTEFNYGSELTWRLPGYSPSIDGRTIFPDSVAADFAFVIYGRRRSHASTWRHADVALVNRTFWLAPVLDTQPGWVFLAQAGRGWSGGALWATRDWWRRWGDRSAVPALGLRPGDPRATCRTGDHPAR